MKKSFIIIVFGIVLLGIEASRPVTNEDIRDAILSVVHMIRTTEDKLERHEYRERNLGDQLKKSLLTLDKRLKLLDPVKGTISRLDDRLATVEAILIQKDERERIQLQKTFDTVEDIQKNLPVVIDKMKQEIIEKLSNAQIPTSNTQQQPQNNDILKKQQENLENKLDGVSASLLRLEKELQKLQNESKSVKDLNGRSTETLDKVKKQLNESEHLLEKYEHKLNEMNNKVPLMASDSQHAVGDKGWQTKFLQALDVQKSNVEQILSDMKNVAAKVQKLPEKRDLENVHNETLETLEKVTNGNNEHADLNDKFNDIKENVNEKHKIISGNLNEIEKILKGIESSLGTNPNTAEKLDMSSLLTKLDTVSNALKELPNKTEVENIKKEALEKLDQISFETYNPDMHPMVQDAGFETVDIKLKQIKEDSEIKHQQVMSTIKEMGNATNALTERFGTNYLQLSDEIEKLGKLEEIILQTDDSVRDTKRRVEYGVHQVVGELGEILRRHFKDINTTVNNRFDNFEVDMFGEENGALANFTLKIGSEIDKVWRQIGILHQQMSQSALTLNNLLNYTDQYANSSMTVMDGMKGKVGTIKEKMIEVDDNLNFLLGKLHLTTQEFNQVRNELAKVLDDIKKNFQKVQKKVEDIGPGPHSIENENENGLG